MMAIFATFPYVFIISPMHLINRCSALEVCEPIARNNTIVHRSIILEICIAYHWESQRLEIALCLLLITVKSLKYIMKMNFSKFRIIDNGHGIILYHHEGFSVNI